MGKGMPATDLFREFAIDRADRRHRYTESTELSHYTEIDQIKETDRVAITNRRDIRA